MTALAVACLLCWVMALVARPRKPLPGNEVQELVYSRLLGRQQILALLAFVVTAATFIAVLVSMPQHLDPDLSTVREAHSACIAARQAASEAQDGGGTALAHCYELQPGGRWEEKVERSDGTWLMIATLVNPPRFTQPTAVLGGAVSRP